MGLIKHWRKGRKLRAEMERLYRVWTRAGYEAEDMAVISMTDYHAAMIRAHDAYLAYQEAEYAWRRFQDTA